MLTDEQKRLMRNLTPDLIFEVMGNNPDMTLKEMMDADSKARGSGEMRYFPKVLFGQVPSYAVFIGILTKESGNSEALDRFLCDIKEIEYSQSMGRMEGIARTFDGDATEGRRFGMYSQINKAYGKQLERLDKKIAKHTEERKVDLLEKLVDKLSDKQLLQVRDNVQGALIDVRGENVDVK